MATLLLGTTIGGYTAIHAGNIGAQSVNYASSAGSVTWANVSGRPTALSQFTNDLSYATQSWVSSQGYLTASSAVTNATNAVNLYGPGASTIRSSSAGTSYNANYQIRENDGGYGNTSETYAPQLAFHWGNVVASSIMMEASGRMAIRNNPGTGYENFIASIIYSSGYGNSTEWNSAYAWGNHANAGYLRLNTWEGNSYIATSGAHYGTIYYDANDSTYYLDPNSSSRLRNLYVGDSGSNWSNPGSWDTTLYVSGPSHSIIRVENRGNNYQAALHSHTGQLPGVGTPDNYDFRITRNWVNRMVFNTDYTYAYGYLEAQGSLRAPIFYDSNDTTYYLDPNSSTSGYFSGVLLQNNGKYVRDSSYRTYSGRSDKYSGGSAGWYRIAQITLTGNCSGAVLYGTLYDHRYDGADAYQISVVARAECGYQSDNEQHYINVGCTILGSTNYVDYKSKFRVILSESVSGRRTYELQVYETPWNHDTWQIESNGWTVYTSPEDPGASTGTARVNYVSNQSADYQRANTAMYAPIYYAKDDTGYYLNPNSTSNLNSIISVETRGRKNQSAGTYTTAALWTESYGNTTTGIAFHISGVIGKFLEMRTDGTLYWNGDTVMHSGNANYAWNMNQYLRTSDAPSFQYIGVNPSGASNNGFGISLYGGASAGPTYGIFFQGTGTYGNHGSVTGDWATYFTMNNDDSRGWIWRKASTGNIASLSAGGVLQVDGSMRAPIFYDSNNTNYYVDPDGTSSLNVITLGNSGSTNHRNEISIASLPSWGTSGKAFMNDIATYGVDGIGLVIQVGYSDGGDVGGIKITDDGVIIWGAGDEDLLRVYNEDGGTLAFRITDGNEAYLSNNLYVSGGNSTQWNTAYSWGNHAAAGYVTGSHNHDDRYYTESESDSRFLRYRGVNVESDFQRFQDNVGEIRFDQINNYNNLSNPPGGYNYGGVLSMRGDNFGFQIWGSHTGDLYYKTQWSDDQYSGWRSIITSANIGSQSVSYASTAGNANSVAWGNVSGRPGALSQFTNDSGYITSSGTVSLLASNLWSSSSGNGAVRVVAPAGASASWDGGITGALRIRLPIRGNNTMWSMHIRIYNYAGNQTSEYTLGNYSYDQGGYNASAHFMGGANAAVHNVRFGNQDGYDCIWIGETGTSWSYPVISVTDFTGGFRNGEASTWDDNWHITYVTSFGTVASIIYPTVRVGGLNASSTVNVSGDVNATYFYGAGSIRLGDMWSGAGLYRPDGNMVFGIENSDWVFSARAVTQAYFAGGDGNLWMRWAGDWLSNLLAAKQNASSAINTSNIGSQSVNYASSAGSVAYSNITGRPGWMTSASLIDGHSNANDWRNSGFYENGGGGSNWPSQTWYNSINVRHSNQGNYHGFQVAMSYYDNNLWFRSYNGSGSFQSWNRALGTQTDTYPSNMNQYVRTSDAVTFTDIYNNGWFRNNTQNQGLYNQSSGNHFYSKAGGAWAITGAGAGVELQFRSNHETTIRGYVYGDTSSNFGLLNDQGGWSVRCYSGSSYGGALSGTWTASGDLVAYSDARVKTDVATIDNALEKVLQLRGVTYVRTDGDDHSQKIGVIAQEVREVLPQVVHEQTDGMLGVSYGNIVGVLIEAIKEQQKEIEELKAKLN